MPDLLLLERKRGGKLAGDPLVVMPDPKKHHDEERDEYHDDPCALALARHCSNLTSDLNPY